MAFPGNVGDPIWYSGRDCTSRIVQIGTCGWKSHTGILFQMPLGPHTGELVIMESTTLAPSPCLIQGRHVSGLQCQPIHPRLDEYQGRVWVSRLIESLDSGEQHQFSVWCYNAIKRGVPYDYKQAIESALMSRRLCGFGKVDLHAVFCSEVVGLALEHVDRVRFENVSGLPPRSLYRRLRSYGIVERARRYK